MPEMPVLPKLLDAFFDECFFLVMVLENEIIFLNDPNVLIPALSDQLRHPYLSSFLFLLLLPMHFLSPCRQYHPAN